MDHPWHCIVAGVAIAAAASGAHAYFRRFNKFRSRVLGIIPARFASSRFSGKPLVQILCKPMNQRTWKRAKLAASLDHVARSIHMIFHQSDLNNFNI